MPQAVDELCCFTGASAGQEVGSAETGGEHASAPLQKALECGVLTLL